MSVAFRFNKKLVKQTIQNEARLARERFDAALNQLTRKHKLNPGQRTFLENEMCGAQAVLCALSRLWQAIFNEKREF